MTDVIIPNICISYVMWLMFFYVARITGSPSAFFEKAFYILLKVEDIFSVLTYFPTFSLVGNIIFSDCSNQNVD